VAALFDAYLMVDWSANSQPKTGKDSIWWCLVDRQGGKPGIGTVSNPATREQATSEIKDALLEIARSDQRMLVGFDFAYGYPRGFARYLAPSDQAAWLRVWEGLAKRIEDWADNRNNRFQVAADFNRAITGTAAPFWGCPASQAGKYLSRNKPAGEIPAGLAEFRLAEARARAQSTWKLAYIGAVGSQVLLGLPHLYGLRTDPQLEPLSCVWPFETGLRVLEAGLLAEKRIVHAEIYPSLIDVGSGNGQVKDRLQVRNLALHFARLDQDGRLGELFAGDPGLSGAERRAVEREEGWILGVR
jgi:precorrin-8X/cobalt-precorrin-8 methylmutase